MELKIGDKVRIPLTKTYPGHCNLDNSGVVDKAIVKNQDHLFITNIDGDCYILDYTEGFDSGDFFSINDLVPYDQIINEYNIY